MLNIIEQSQVSRKIQFLKRRLQKDEGYFAGVEISTVRIANGSITTAKIEDGAITNAKIANATIENAKIDTLNASKITVGELSADRIAVNSIVADKLNVSSLSAIVADLGSINAGSITGVSITGGTIRTSSGSTRVEITESPERFTVYDGGNKRVEMGAGSVIFYGGNSIQSYVSSILIAQFDASSTSMNLITTSDASILYLADTDSGDMIISANDIVHLIGVTVKLNGATKTAIVPTSKGYRSLYISESPDLWFMDFYKDKIDPMFKEVTAGKSFEFECTNGNKLLFAKRKGFEDTRFEEKTELQFQRNNKKYAY